MTAEDVACFVTVLIVLAALVGYGAIRAELPPPEDKEWVERKRIKNPTR